MTKVGQIDPKWDKSETFSVQISDHFGAVRQNDLKSDLKKSRNCPIWSQSDPHCVEIWHPGHDTKTMTKYSSEGRQVRVSFDVLFTARM